MTDHYLRCPRSSTALTRLRIGGIDTDLCEDCGGLWLDRLELARFQHPASAFGDALGAHLKQFPPTLIDHSIRLPCPRHPDVVMLRRKFSLRDDGRRLRVISARDMHRKERAIYAAKAKESP